MTTTGIRSLLAAGVLAACACMAGCGAIGPVRTQGEGPGSAHTPAGEPLTPQAALQRLSLGRSSKAEVSASLGKAIVIAFDSGYEVWVYRWPGADRSARAATELVVLFDPAGVAAKARVRPGYPPDS